MSTRERRRSSAMDLDPLRWTRCRKMVGLGFAVMALLSIGVGMGGVDGAVMSIDLGSEWMKVAVVDLKAGRAPISIALNEMSKRKSPAMVAISNGERLLADEAAGINVRYPDRVYSRIRDVVGVSEEPVRRMLDANYLPYDVVLDGRGAVQFRTHDKRSVFGSEELLAMILSYGQKLAESHAKSSIKDAVITVPPYLGQAERRGILDAAQVAGITVLALVNEHSGAALQYGIDKDFGNESRNVVFYDMGATNIYAAVVYFSAYPGKDKGRVTYFNQFQVKGVSWDAELGGQVLDARLMDHFAKEFNEQVGGGFDVRKFPKAMAKLKKQVKRTKEILSANVEAPLSVEAIHDDRDFRSSITRQKFEDLCGDLWERAVVPLKEVLRDTGLRVEDIYAVELIGGATRVPKLQAVLSEFVGRKGLDRHLDADEAVALGASLHAANLSDRVKLNRKFGMMDVASYGIVWKLDGASPGSLEDENGEQILFPRYKKVPSKVLRSLKGQMDDFKISLEYYPGLLPPGTSSPEFAAFQISGVADTVRRYASYNLSAPIKTNLQFSLSQSSVINLDKAECVVEVSELYEVPLKNLTTENATAEVKAKTSEESAANGQDIQAQKSNSSDTAESSSSDGLTGGSDSLNESQEAEPLVKKKLRKRTIRVPLQIKDIRKGVTQSLPPEAILEAVARFAELQRKDAEKRKTAEAKNSLEAYIYNTNGELDSTANIEIVSTEQERDALRADLSKAEDWLYMDGEDGSAEEFQGKLAGLKKSREIIFTRLAELEARPVAVKTARSYLKTVDETLGGWAKSKPWIPESSKDKVRKEMKSFKKWLDDVELKQQKLKDYEDPAFTSTLVYTKVGTVTSLVAALEKLPKPKPPVVEKPKETPEMQTTPTDSETKTSGQHIPPDEDVIDESASDNQGFETISGAEESDIIHEEL